MSVVTVVTAPVGGPREDGKGTVLGWSMSGPGSGQSCACAPRAYWGRMRLKKPAKNSGLRVREYGIIPDRNR